MPSQAAGWWWGRRGRRGFRATSWSPCPRRLRSQTSHTLPLPQGGTLLSSTAFFPGVLLRVFSRPRRRSGGTAVTPHTQEVRTKPALYSGKRRSWFVRTASRAGAQLCSSASTASIGLRCPGVPLSYILLPALVFSGWPGLGHRASRAGPSPEPSRGLDGQVCHDRGLRCGGQTARIQAVPECPRRGRLCRHFRI